MDFKKLRKTRNMTQTEAAKSIGISYMSWQRWEWGGCKSSKENMERISCKKLNNFIKQSCKVGVINSYIYERAFMKAGGEDSSDNP